MGTKKEIAKEKAIKGGMPQDVADNIFRMQMNNPSKTKDTPGTFNAKDQKVMAMSTMFQTPDPDGTLDLSTPDQNISYLEVDEVEIPASRKVENFAKDPQEFFNTMAAEAAARGWTGSVADYIKNKEQDLGYRGRTDIIETTVTDTLPGENYQANVFGAFSQGFDSVGGSDKNKTGDGSSKESGKSGMVDTFSALDTRQGKRKVAIEERMQLQDARGEKKQQRKTDRLGRKEEKQAFKELKKQAGQDRRQARKDLNQAKRQNRQAKRSTRDAFSASPNISGSAGFGLKSGMISSDRSVADAKARLEATKSNLKSTRKNRPDTAAEQRRQRKQTFQDTRKRLASERAVENRKIVEQGKAQRSAGKNPLITKEFDPSSPIFMAKRKMSFRK